MCKQNINMFLGHHNKYRTKGIETETLRKDREQKLF